MYRRVRIENTSDVIRKSKRPTGLKKRGILLQDYKTGYYWIEAKK